MFGRLFYGLVAFLAANSALFLVAHQAFGDIFVLLVIGWFSGFIIAYPRMQGLDNYAQQRGTIGLQTITTVKRNPDTVRLKNPW
jgi:hypothetical protein